ncbi:NAD(P)-dependent malic enzyme [Dendrosporobacter sp. 1207_IL3150]|uniref:NAD(P)-dependent malic enzyme n=1 Tax=Dendrosporobacter sp. 1207_IL3150 TaxID=3084054 RepID=UPI002FD8FBA5
MFSTDIKQESLNYHSKNKGKLEIAIKVPLNNSNDLGLAYTPGVAEPCKEIKENKLLSFEYTCRSNLIAVVSDGSRVLGLGDIGPEAAMPVMEGKAILFKAFADVDAVPICINTKEPNEIIETIKRLEPTFGGINLEDFSSPKCYDIEDKLIEILDIPVFHDDQHGTAIAALAALIGALRFVKKELRKARIVVNGAGAAGTAIGRILVSAGCENVIMLTSKGILHQDSPNLDRIKQYLASVTNKNGLTGNLVEAANGADVLFGVSKPNLFTPEMIKSMAKDPIVFAMANPVPEISYHDAINAGARVAGTGRSDAPNQVNNASVFPGLFRGALDVRASVINEEMKLAAAFAITSLITDSELREDYIVPNAMDQRLAPSVAAAVAKAAIDTGVARVIVDPELVKKRCLERTEGRNFLN